MMTSYLKCKCGQRIIVDSATADDWETQEAYCCFGESWCKELREALGEKRLGLVSIRAEMCPGEPVQPILACSGLYVPPVTIQGLSEMPGVSYDLQFDWKKIVGWTVGLVVSWALLYGAVIVIGDAIDAFQQLTR